MVLWFLTFAFWAEQADVQVHGALREIMHQGNLSSRISLEKLESGEDLYGLGAIADLKGEILIIGGQILVANAIKGEVVVYQATDQGAALLVTTRVSKWQSHNLPDQVRTLPELEAFLKTASANAGLNPSKPFPFMIEGTVAEAHWHVINWPTGDKNHSHMKHKTSGANGVMKSQKVTILGFHSTDHKGVFTHHTRDVHMHIATVDQNLVAHVDDLIILPGAKLMLPNP